MVTGPQAEAPRAQPPYGRAGLRVPPRHAAAVSRVTPATCTGATQFYTGTDTVQNGVIVAANVAQTG